MNGIDEPMPAEDSRAAPQRAMAHALDALQAEDPWIKVKAGGLEVFHVVASGLRDENGVHAETFLCALGALGGYACQASVLAQQEREPNSNIELHHVRTADGEVYLFGDALNAPLAESEHSIFRLAAASAQAAGCTDIPDLAEIFQHVAASLGSDAFGVPRLPDDHRPGALPVTYLRVMWPHVQPVAMRYCKTPSDMPMVFGLAIQRAIESAAEAIDPELALRIVMESAVPMSKVRLDGRHSQAGIAARSDAGIKVTAPPQSASNASRPHKNARNVLLLLVVGTVLAVALSSIRERGEQMQTEQALRSFDTLVEYAGQNQQRMQEREHANQVQARDDGAQRNAADSEHPNARQ